MRIIASKSILYVALVLVCAYVSVAGAADKPNILVIWGDDIGTWNISHNSRGMMGYKTPNIDRHRQRRALPSPTTTASRAAPPDAPPSSVAAFPSAAA